MSRSDRNDRGGIHQSRGRAENASESPRHGRTAKFGVRRDPTAPAPILEAMRHSSVRRTLGSRQWYQVCRSTARRRRCTCVLCFPWSLSGLSEPLTGSVAESISHYSQIFATRSAVGKKNPTTTRAIGFFCRWRRLRGLWSISTDRLIVQRPSDILAAGFAPCAAHWPRLVVLAGIVSSNVDIRSACCCSLYVLR
jgi:hypothetical protein